MISFPRALIAATAAWLVAVFAFVAAIIIQSDVRIRLSHLDEWFQIIRYLSLPFGIVIFTTFLVVVAPLLAFVPRAWPLWKPGWACAAAAIISALCTTGCQPSYAPYLLAGDSFSRHLTAILCGVTFAFIYTVLMARHRAPRQPADDA